MYEHPSEEVHRLLETVEAAIQKLGNYPDDTIQVMEVPELIEVVLEVLDSTNTAYVENDLGINSALLNKFVKMRGEVRKHTAIALANRIRTYLRSQDQAFGPHRTTVHDPIVDEPNGSQADVRSGSTTFPAQQWVMIPHRSDVKHKIGVISAMLDSIIQQVRGSNAPDEEQALTEIEKAELIAVLETALLVLRSPMVEHGLLQKSQGVLKKGVERTAEKAVQEGLGTLMSAARQRIAELVTLLLS